MSTDLTHDDVESILKMIDAAEHLEEIEIAHGGFRLHVVRSGGAALPLSPQATARTEIASQVATEPRQMAAQSVAAPARPTAPAGDMPKGTVAIRAPMLGVFYQASGPGEKPFVQIGQRVRADDIVCLIEVMKLFNSIHAGVDGEIIKIAAENGALVEYDQALIYVMPSKG